MLAQGRDVPGACRVTLEAEALNKSSISTRFGVHGAGYTIGPKGERVTVGLPGTGLSYTEQGDDTAVTGSFWRSFWAGVGIGLLVTMSRILKSLFPAKRR